MKLLSTQNSPLQDIGIRYWLPHSHIGLRSIWQWNVYWKSIKDQVTGKNEGSAQLLLLDKKWSALGCEWCFTSGSEQDVNLQHKNISQPLWKAEFKERFFKKGIRQCDWRRRSFCQFKKWVDSAKTSKSPKKKFEFKDSMKLFKQRVQRRGRRVNKFDQFSKKIGLM